MTKTTQDGAALNIRVIGTCMQPTIDHGAKVRIQEVRFYWPGDLLLVRRAKNFQLHRFLGYRWTRRGIGVCTQADDGHAADPAATLDRVFGRAQVQIQIRDRLRALLRYGYAIALSLRRALR